LPFPATRLVGILSWEWMQICEICFYMKHFCITILSFLWWVGGLILLYMLYIVHNFYGTLLDAFLLFLHCYTDYDGLALGSKFVGISTIHCELCQGLWYWSKPPYSQRDMEGSQVLCSAFILRKHYSVQSGKFDVFLDSCFLKSIFQQ